MKLSIIDQSAIYGDMSPNDALHRTIKLAQHAEKLGFERFWVSEHHHSNLFAGSSPEVILGAIGASTTHIRIGSGGVMLPHYSAYKVAENFAVLSNLFPNRVGLGVGRAPGTDKITAKALARDGEPKFEQFPELLSDLVAYLHQEKQPKVTPPFQETIPLWLLGTSSRSAKLAGEMGLPYAIGAFVNPMIEMDLVEHYLSNFQPTLHNPEPYSILALICICCEDAERLALLEKSVIFAYMDLFMGKRFQPIAPPEVVAQKQSVLPHSSLLKYIQQSYIFSTPDQIKSEIEVRAKQFNVDEVMILTPTFYESDQFNSLEWIAKDCLPD